MTLIDGRFAEGTVRFIAAVAARNADFQGRTRIPNPNTKFVRV